MPIDNVFHLNKTGLDAALPAYSKLFLQKLDFKVEPSLAPEEKELLSEYADFLSILKSYQTAYFAEIYAIIEAAHQNWREEVLALLKQRALLLIHLNYIQGFYEEKEKKRLIALLAAETIDYGALLNCNRKVLELRETVELIKLMADAENNVKAQIALKTWQKEKIDNRQLQQERDIAGGIVYNDNNAADKKQRVIQFAKAGQHQLVKDARILLKNMGLSNIMQDFLSEYANQTGFMQAGGAHFERIMSKELGLITGDSKITYQIEKRTNNQVALTTIVSCFSYTTGSDNPATMQTRTSKNGHPCYTSYTTFLVEENPSINVVSVSDRFANLSVKVENCFMECNSEVTQVIEKSAMQRIAEKYRRDNSKLSAIEKQLLQNAKNKNTHKAGTISNVALEKMDVDSSFVMACENANHAKQILTKAEHREKLSLLEIQKIERQHGSNKSFQDFYRRHIKAYADDKAKKITRKTEIQGMFDKMFDDKIIYKEKEKILAELIKKNMTNAAVCQLVFEVLHDYPTRSVASILQWEEFTIKFSQQQLTQFAMKDQTIAEVLFKLDKKPGFKEWVKGIVCFQWNKGSLETLIFNNPNNACRKYVAETVAQNPRLMKLLMQTDTWKSLANFKIEQSESRKKIAENNADRMVSLYLKTESMRTAITRSPAIIKSIISYASDESYLEFYLEMNKAATSEQLVKEWKAIVHKIEKLQKAPDTRELKSVMRWQAAHLTLIENQFTAAAKNNLRKLTELKSVFAEYWVKLNKLDYITHIATLGPVCLEHMLNHAKVQEILRIDATAVSVLYRKSGFLLNKAFANIKDVQGEIKNSPRLMAKIKQYKAEQIPVPNFQLQLDTNIQTLLDAYKTYTPEVRRHLVMDSKLLNQILYLASPVLLPDFIECDKELGKHIAEVLVSLYCSSEVIQKRVDLNPCLFDSEQFSRAFLFNFTRPQILDKLCEDNGLLEKIFVKHPVLVTEFAASDLSSYMQKDSLVKRFIDKVIVVNNGNAEFKALMQCHNSNAMHLASITPRKQSLISATTPPYKGLDATLLKVTYEVDETVPNVKRDLLPELNSIIDRYQPMLCVVKK